jgi:hypothetical protein
MNVDEASSNRSKILLICLSIHSIYVDSTPLDLFYDAPVACSACSRSVGHEAHVTPTTTASPCRRAKALMTTSTHNTASHVKHAQGHFYSSTAACNIRVFIQQMDSRETCTTPCDSPDRRAAIPALRDSLLPVDNHTINTQIKQVYHSVD